jgi:hypothetical protein
MIYALILIYLYIIPCIYFYREIMDEEEVMFDLSWVLPVFAWPVLLPFYFFSKQEED